jgi:hypothetical protein
LNPKARFSAVSITLGLLIVTPCSFAKKYIGSTIS